MEHPLVIHPLSSPERRKVPLVTAAASSSFRVPTAAADSPASAALWAQQQHDSCYCKYSEANDDNDDDDNSSISSLDHDSDSITLSSTTDDDDDDDIVSEEEERQETAVAQALVKAAFDRRLGAPVLKRLIASAVQAENRDNDDNELLPPPLKKQCLRRVSLSEPAISTLLLPPKQPLMPFPQERLQGVMKPDDFLEKLVNESSVDGTTSSNYCYQTFAALDLPHFFEPISPASIAAYDMTVLQAVRTQDIEALQALHESGRNLQCGNRFGETVVHTAARRGALSVLQFLVQQAGVSVKVCCDNGRTALHDACWSTEPNFDVIALLLDACPDLLYMTDKRGFTPLAYIRSTTCEEWCQFLQERGVERLLPKELKFRTRVE